MNERNITRLFNVIDRSLFTIVGKLDYDRVTDALIKLANTLHETETDEFVWCIGGHSNCCLDDLIVGAYWHYTEWHGGQQSKGYQALSALGQVFTPNMSSLDPDAPEYVTYEMLASMARQFIRSSNHDTNTETST